MAPYARIKTSQQITVVAQFLTCWQMSCLSHTIQLEKSQWDLVHSSHECTVSNENKKCRLFNHLFCTLYFSSYMFQNLTLKIVSNVNCHTEGGGQNTRDMYGRKTNPKSQEIGEWLNTDETGWMEMEGIHSEITIHNKHDNTVSWSYTKRDGVRKKNVN